MNTDIFIAGPSAALYWRLSLGKILSGGRASRIMGISTSASSFREINEILSDHAAVCPDEIVDLPWPLHILVPRDDRRPSSSRIQARVWPHELPPGSFWQVDKHIYVASPQFLFLLMAAELGSVELAMFGNEACGLFAYRPDNEDGILRRAQLTTTRDIKTFVDRIEGVKGIKRARLVSKWLLDRARSPMESEFGLRFWLKQHWGGYGTGRPELNFRMPLSERAARIAGQHFVEMDLYWPPSSPDGRGLDVEYIGEKWHRNRVGKDARRRNALEDSRVDVVEVSSDQSRSVRALNDIADLVREHLGMKKLSLSDGDMRRIVGLHEELLRIRWQGEACRTHDGNGIE